MKARITIMLKSAVLDPQGKAIQTSLHHLGFEQAKAVRQGKVIDLDLEETDEAAARASLEDMCKKLLANPVMETYRIEIVG